MTNTSCITLELGNPYISWGKLSDFIVTPRFAVQVRDEKLYGDDKGWVTVTVVGVRPGRDVDLLVELPAPRTLGHHGVITHTTVHATDTREGWRFNRTVGRAMKLLARLGREGSRKRQTAEKLAERRAARAGREGVCQICESEQIIKNGNLVLHGYERPGRGYITGRCRGVNEPHWGLSCDALKRFVAMLVDTRQNCQNSLGTLHERTEVTVERGRHQPPQIIKVGEPGFARRIEEIRRDLESTIRNLNTDITYQNKRLENWKPQ